MHTSRGELPKLKQLFMNTTTPFPVNCPAHDPHPHQPRIVVPAHACDVHAHVCGPQEQYPLIANRLYTPPSATLQDYRHMLDTLGIAGDLRNLAGIRSHWYSPLAESDHRIIAPAPLFPRLELPAEAA